MADTDKNDLTVIFLTFNEHPAYWTKFHQDKLFEAIGDYPLITVTNKELGLRGKEIIQTEYSHLNMYRQLLKAARLAETPYVAVAESDTLYHPEHFRFYRPPQNAVAYDMSKWSLFTWNPVYNIRRRISNATLIAPRNYLIDALKERYEKMDCPPDRIGEVGRQIHEQALGLTPRKAIEVWCPYASVVFSHPNAIGYKQMHHPTRKRFGEIQALEIPYWGRADKLAQNYR